MTRKEFLKIAAAPTALAAMPVGAMLTAAHADAPDTATTSGHKVDLVSDTFHLSITADKGLQCRLTHIPTGLILADGFYSYSIGPITFTHAILNQAYDVVLEGQSETGLVIQHRFVLNPKTSWLEESIKLANTTPHPQRIDFRCGFVLPITDDSWLKNCTFTAVPYRREPNGDRHQYADYKLEQVLYERRRSHLREKPPEVNASVSCFSVARFFTEDYFSEGWALSDGKQGFLITKYNQAARDFSILDGVPLNNGIGLRWGGAGTLNDAEGSYRLAAGAARDFGVTRLTAFTGDYVQGFYAFRSEMDARGHALADSYDPPSHWNELYDNKLWWTGDHANPEKRKQLYTLADMKQAAASARDMGCEALYCDPGWDTPQSSHIWGEERLGKLDDFIAMLKNEYGGLQLSLHAPLASWSGPTCDMISGTALVRTEHGGPSPFECSACITYQEETARRMKILGDAGVSFLMYDGTLWMGECWAKDHGHSYPSTSVEHVEGLNRIARLVHKTNPNMLIEMHDQMMTGIWLRYVPSYYGHGPNAAGEVGWNEIWAFELMWSPMDDLVGGHSMALYYFNLAYSIPAYIHIDLRKDNAQCLMLWWNISTCRHLGVGGTHPNENIRKSQRETIATYRRLKPFFTTGTFYGIDELTHVHIDRKKTGAVINCFNLDNKPVDRDFTFDPALYGLNPGKTYTFKGATLTKTGASYTGKVTIADYGHTLIEIT